MDFWTAICVCHNLIVEGDAVDGTFCYQVHNSLFVPQIIYALVPHCPLRPPSANSRLLLLRSAPQSGHQHTSQHPS